MTSRPTSQKRFWARWSHNRRPSESSVTARRAARREHCCAGFVSCRASKVFLGDIAARASESRGFEDPDHSDRAAELAQASSNGGDMLAREGSNAQETPKLFKGPKKSSGRRHALGPSHRYQSLILRRSARANRSPSIALHPPLQKGRDPTHGQVGQPEILGPARVLTEPRLAD